MFYEWISVTLRLQGQQMKMGTESLEGPQLSLLIVASHHRKSERSPAWLGTS